MTCCIFQTYSSDSTPRQEPSCTFWRGQHPVVATRGGGQFHFGFEQEEGTHQSHHSEGSGFGDGRRSREISGQYQKHRQLNQHNQKGCRPNQLEDGCKRRQMRFQGKKAWHWRRCRSQLPRSGKGRQCTRGSDYRIPFVSVVRVEKQKQMEHLVVVVAVVD